MTTDPAAPPPPPETLVAPAAPGRGLRIALAVSVALNLAVAGVVAGAVWRMGSDGRPVPAVRDLGFGPFAGALTDDDRRELRRAFLRQAPDMRATRAAMREDMAAVLAALRSDPYDPQALRVALDRATRRTAERLALGQDLIFDRISAMTPEARRAFADRLEQGLTRGRGGAPAP